MSDFPISARYAPSTLRGWTMFWSAWTLAGLAMLATGLRHGSAFLALTVAGAVLAVVAGALLLRFRRRLSDPRPVIVLTAETFHDRRLGPPIPWTEVKSLRRHQPGSRIFLLIDADRPERFIAPEGSAYAGAMRRVNPALGFPAICTRLDGLDIPQDRIAAAAEAAHAAARGGA